MSYDYTINLGNEIQTIAARRFLPKIDYYIDHERLNSFDEDTDVKLIMNGWYLDCLKAWPPSNSIDPLLVSMHFNPKPENQEVILAEESREFLCENGPVGCRDVHTQEFLQKNDIDAYFSGCLTLTLDTAGKYNNKDEDNEYIILSLDYPNDMLSYLREKTDKKIYVINQDFPPAFENAYLGSISKNLNNYSTFYNFEEKMFIAENFLRLYENASCIITDRLHCALPSLALQTPVLLFNSRRNQERFDGLNNLIRRTTIEEYMESYNIFDVENPPENPKEYLKLRKNLIEKCKKFTGHINESCFSNVTFNEMLDKNTLFLSNHSKATRDYIKSILKMSQENKMTYFQQRKEIREQKKEIKEYEKQLKEKDKLIDKYEKQLKAKDNKIKEFSSSTSWKITSPLRKIRK